MGDEGRVVGREFVRPLSMEVIAPRFSRREDDGDTGIELCNRIPYLDSWPLPARLAVGASTVEVMCQLSPECAERTKTARLCAVVI